MRSPCHSYETGLLRAHMDENPVRGSLLPIPMSSELEQLRAGIAALEAQRALLGDSVADAALKPLRARFEFLTRGDAGALAQTLKQVTILFLDVVGSTTLSEHLDPEDVHAVLDE